MLSHQLKTFLKIISNFRIKKWISIFIFALLLGGSIILTSEVHELISGGDELIGRIDRKTLSFLIEKRSPKINVFMIDLTALGSATVLTVITIFLCTYFTFIKKIKPTIHLLLSIIGSGIITWLLKFYFERSRPDTFLRLVEVEGYSYPSGHSLSSAAAYFTICAMVCKSIQRGGARSILWVLSLGLIFLIGVTRVYLGVHYFSDVLAGILIGIAWASLVEQLVLYFEKLYLPQNKG